MKKISITLIGFLLLAGVSLEARRYGGGGSSFGGAFAGSAMGSMIGAGIASAGRRSTDTVVVREGNGGSEALRSDIRYLGDKIDKMMRYIESIEKRLKKIERETVPTAVTDED